MSFTDLCIAVSNGVIAFLMFQWGTRVGRRREREEFRRNPFSKVGR